jgi:exopolysaccharide biosynthesis polyprenyl glycosylphosphotransferase
MTIGIGYPPWLPSRARAQTKAEARSAVARLRPATSTGALTAAGDVVAISAALLWFLPTVLEWWVPAFLVGVLALSAFRGHYRTRITLSVSRDAGSIVTCVAIPLVTLAVLAGLGRQAGSFLEAGVAAGFAMFLVRGCTYASIRRLRTRGVLGERTLIVGAGQVAVRFADTLDEHPEYGLRPVGFLDDCEGEDLPHPLLGSVEHLDAVLHEQKIDRVVLAFGVSRETALVDVLRACEDTVVDIHVLPRFFELGFAAEGNDVDLVWGYPLLRLRRAALRFSPRMAKRLFDVCVAGLMLILCSPVYGALALAVKLTSPGPVYFRQARVGKRGDVVEVLKFRSMRINSDSDTQWNVGADSRVTALGSFMRKTSLDELPQLWNVVRGDMSLVGPRPERPFFVEQFNNEIPSYKDRHRVPVGLTGLAQVNGLRGDTSIDERAWFDNYYIDNWSMGRDLVILARTVGAVIKHARS